jgi:CBS domain-containing protein
MLLRDVMTSSLEVIEPQATVKEAAEKMRLQDVGVLPVCEADRLVGMITDRDIAVRAVAQGRDPIATQVRDAMTPDVICCFDDDDVQKAIALMEEKQIRRLMVCDHSKHPIGIVSLGDLAVRLHNEHLSGEVLENVSKSPATQTKTHA